MKIALIEVKSKKKDYVAKEMAGGLGKRIRLGDNVLGSVLNRYLTSRFNAPPIILANLSAICRRHTQDVIAYHTHELGDVDPGTSIAIVLSSMVDYSNEVDFIRKMKSARPHVKVIVVGSFATAMPEIYANVCYQRLCSQYVAS